MPDTGFQLAQQIFQQNSLKLIRRFVPMSAAAFCWKLPFAQKESYILNNLDYSLHKGYAEHYGYLDPISPQKYQGTSKKVAATNIELTRDELHRTAFYQEFMQPNEFEHIANMFITLNRAGSGVIAIIRNRKLPPFSKDEIITLNRLQEYVEYSANLIFNTSAYQAIPEHLQEMYQLTQRELDMLQLIIKGASNKEIQEHLKLSLSTVKTHISNVFKKVGVHSRTELLSKIFEKH